MNIRSLLNTILLFIFMLGISAQASAYSTAPSWMPMTMPAVTFNATTNKLAVEDKGINAALSTNTDITYGSPAAGVASFDPAEPYAVLNGTAFSRRLGWWDPAEANTGNTILDQVRAIYGPDANIWIQSMSKSVGLDSYQAIGPFGTDADNTPPISSTVYPGIFGTVGSSAKWLWDGQMDHNTYAVKFSAITKPNQIFSAYYKVYIGDATGNELLTDKNGVKVASAATTTVWTWQGPAFVFTSKTGVTTDTSFESDVYTYSGTATTIAVSGGEYAISTDGGTSWTWATVEGTIADTNKVKVRVQSSSTAGATKTVTLSIPTASGPGTFSVTTTGPDTVPNAFSFASPAIAQAGTPSDSAAVAISGITAPAAISITTGGSYAISTNAGADWGDWTSVAGTIANNNLVKVRVTSSATPGAMASTTLTIGGITGMFTVTTGNPVAPSTTFAAITGAPANTFVSGMPFYVMSNPIAVAADSSISITGGLSPQYSVSTDGGYNWSIWSATTPTTVTAGNQVRVRVVPAATAFTTISTDLSLGGTISSFSVTTGYVNPPSWMPMAMLNVAYDSTVGALTVQDENTHPSFPPGVLPALTYVPVASYDPAKPWSILNGGVALSRQLGWDDATALHGNGITVTGGLINQVKSVFGTSANIWIERVSQSAGLETYFADGMYGVGGTGSGTSGTPQVYSNSMTGLPIIYANNYYGIFGTNGSPTKWLWDGTMIHNVYAVPAAYITQPNQQFSATYRVYVGDTAGVDIAPAAATTETWTWKGPATVPDTAPDAFTFNRLNAVPAETIAESNPITIAGITATAQISVSGGEYSVSADNGATWSPYSATSPSIVANGNQVKVRQTSSAVSEATTDATLTIGGISGAFSVTAVKRSGTNTEGSKPTLFDALVALKAFSGTVSLTPVEKIRYDVAPLSTSGVPLGNGAVDVADVIMILRRSIDIGSW